MRSYRDPALLVFAVAIVASLALHLPVYGALGELADWFDAQAPAPVAQGTSFEFEVGEPGDAPEPESTHDEDVEFEPVDEGEPPAEAETPRERRRPRPEPEPEEEPEPELEEPEVEEEAEALHPPPPAERANLHAIEQHSQNPDVDPPPDTQYVATEANRVEEETVARQRNYQRDDENPNAGEAHEGEVPEEGNAEETEIADLREMEGSDVRTPTESEVEEERPVEAPTTPPPAVIAQGDNEAAGDDAQGGSGDDAQGEESAESAQSAQESSPAEGGGHTEPERIVVNDGIGSFVVERPPRRAPGVGAGNAGGRARPEVRGRAATERSRRGRAGRGRGSSQEGPDLRVAWRQFQEIVGEEQLEQERQAFLQERRSTNRGRNRQRRWREFRAAIENFTPNVRPGNQTALNAAASPFASYIAAIHRRIHRQYADRFIPGLPTFSTSPLADTTLMAKLEIIINSDGSVHRVGIVRSSGFLPFDFGAFNSVMRAQPYPQAPDSILSGDGRVYLHWGFYRNQRQCGVFNSQPFILPNPPGTPGRGGGPLQDRPEWGGVVPDSAESTWGAEPAEGEGEEGESEPAGEPEGDPREPGPAREPSPAPRIPDPPDGVIGRGIPAAAHAASYPT